MEDGLEVGRIAEIWRYPVKSLLGESLTTAEVDPLGVKGDRLVGLRDAADGTILSAKRDGRLFDLAASLGRDGTVTIRLPGGSSIDAGNPTSGRLVSEAVGRSVTLARPAGGRDERIGMGASSDRSEGSGSFPAGVPGSFFDSTPLHLLTTASLAAAAELHPAGRWDRRRFRPNLLIETDGAEGFVEETWVGRELSVGGLRVSVVKPCARCVMTTHAQQELDKDRGILAALARRNGNHLGVLAEVLTSGDIAVGDAVRVQGEPR